MAYDKVTVIEIVAGRHGMWGVRNSNMVPIGGLLRLRNATLEDNTWRTGGGAALFGTPADGRIMAALDYWPDAATQRLLVMTATGKLQKDNGLGTGWVTLASGLTVAGAVPVWAIGGAEAAGRARKAFYADGVNTPQVLSGDGVATANIADPHADWSGGNQPRGFVIHQGYNWAFAPANAPHTVYRSLITDHEDFSTTPFRLLTGPTLFEDRVTAGLSFKNGILFWKFPTGVYFIDTRDPDPDNWFPVRVANPGAAGPRCITPWEDDVLWVSPDGSWHSLRATNAFGSVAASDISYEKLGHSGAQTVEPEQLQHADLLYYAHKRGAWLGHAPKGSAAKTGRLHLDLNNRKQVGANWLTWDRDRNEALFLRRESGIDVPYFGDETGQVWALDRAGREKNGQGYTFEWFLRDTDFSPILKGWAGRKMNLKFLQLEYDAVGDAEHTVEVWIDGRVAQTVTFTLEGGGIVLDDSESAQLDVNAVFGIENLQPTDRKRLFGRAKRLALRGFTNAPGKDVSIARILLGLTKAA